MQTKFTRKISILAAGAMLLFALQAQAQNTQAAGDTSSQKEAHAHEHASDDIYKGLFEDSQIQPRTLKDWVGDWQSVYPYLLDGTLEPVMAAKAAHGDKTAEEYRAYYLTGYQTDVDRIVIKDGSIVFHTNGKSVQAAYAADGHEILTYKAGNRGVRYIFTKTAGDEDAPQFIQFSDHRIAPAASDHYHLYWGNDRAALLQEVTNWPTYYPADLGGDDIVSRMMAH